MLCRSFLIAVCVHPLELNPLGLGDPLDALPTPNTEVPLHDEGHHTVQDGHDETRRPDPDILAHNLSGTILSPDPAP